MNRSTKQPKGQPMIPPPLKISPVYRRTMRFRGASGTAIVTQKSMLSLLIANNSGGTVGGLALMEAAKIRNVRIWANDTAATQTITLLWTGAGPGSRTTVTGNSAIPAKMSTRPPPDSLANDWTQHNLFVMAGANAAGISTTDLFQVISNCAYILDLDFEFTLENGAMATVVGTGIANTQLSHAQLDSLDRAGTGAGTALLTPIGLDLLTTLTSRTG